MFNKISSLFIALTLAAVVNADFYLGTLTTTVFQGGNLDIRYSTVECNVNDCKGQYTRYAKIGDNMCGNNHVWKRGCSGNDVMGLGGRCGSGDWSKNNGDYYSDLYDHNQNNKIVGRCVYDNLASWEQTSSGIRDSFQSYVRCYVTNC